MQRVRSRISLRYIQATLWFALVKQDVIENLKLKRAHIIARTQARGSDEER